MTQAPDIVTRRCVFFFGGYEHVPAAIQYRRLARELGRFATTWSLAAEAGTPTGNAEGGILRWTIDARGPNWRVATDFVYCAWDDLIAADFARPDPMAVPLGIAALLDAILTGTAFRYFRNNWRYGLFFAYPVVLVAVAAVLAWAAASMPAWFGLPVPWYVQAPLAVLAFWGLVRWPGDRLHLRYMLNDWTFAAGVARDLRPDYRRRIETFVRAIEVAAAGREADEILVVGHSLGAVLAIESLAGALRHRPDLIDVAPPVTLMTVGSSLLKVGLHPRAGRLREHTRALLATPGIAWLDCTALVDVLNFYRADPDRALRLGTGRSPVMRTVKLRAMLSAASHARFKRNFLRMHRQFVMGNEQRYHYDFFMSCCGPMPTAERVENITLSVDNFGADGSYLPAARRGEGMARTANGARS